MKKIIACISLVFAMSAGVTALAATTAEPTDLESDNSVVVTPDVVYNTVLIENGDSDIVYVNQNDAGYTANAATTFLLKADAGYGNYTMKMGGAAGSIEVPFEIAAPTSTDPVALENTYTYTADTHKDLGFILDDGADLDGYDQLTITATQGATGKSLIVPITSITGGATVDIAVKITQVPLDATIAVSVGCSSTN